MPIVLLRVDERLIHGQVVVGWGERTHMERIVVVDDELSDSEWEQELYRLGVPPMVEADFLGVSDAREAFPRWREDQLRRAVLLRDCETLVNLSADGLLKGLEVNLGGLHSSPGRDRVLPYLYLSEEDRARLHEVARSGATVTARDLPGNRAIALEDLVPQG